MYDAPLRQDVDVIGYGQSKAEALFGEEDGHALGLQLVDEVLHLTDDEWRQSLRGLVQDQQRWVADQPSATGEHLLLAAAELGATMPLPLAQTREQLHDSRGGPGPAMAEWSLRNLQVLAHRE